MEGTDEDPWHADADIDYIHHQYAIIIKTPPYKEGFLNVSQASLNFFSPKMFVYRCHDVTFSNTFVAELFREGGKRCALP